MSTNTVELRGCDNPWDLSCTCELYDEAQPGVCRCTHGRWFHEYEAS